MNSKSKNWINRPTGSASTTNATIISYCTWLPQMQVVSVGAEYGKQDKIVGKEISAGFGMEIPDMVAGFQTSGAQHVCNAKQRQTYKLHLLHGTKDFFWRNPSKWFKSLRKPTAYCPFPTSCFVYFSQKKLLLLTLPNEEQLFAGILATGS